MALEVVVGVFDELYLIAHARCQQSLIEDTDAGIVAQDVRYIAIRLFYHHIDGLHDTILYRVILQVEVDVSQTLNHNLSSHRID